MSTANAFIDGRKKNMRRWISIILSAVLLVSNAIAFAQEELITVTLPLSMFGEESPEEMLDEIVTENKMISYSIDENKNVECVFTPQMHQMMIENTKAGYESTIENLLSGEERIQSYVSIEKDDAMTRFDVYVDPEIYGGFDFFGGLTLLFMGNIYQMVMGIPVEEIDVVVTFINNNTQERIEGMSYKEMMAQ